MLIYLILKGFFGGRGGIRTHERLRVGSFQDCCIQPLCHPSERWEVAILTKAFKDLKILSKNLLLLGNYLRRKSHDL